MKNMKNEKKIVISLMILTIIFTFFGGTFAYWRWMSDASEQTNIVFTATQDFRCWADGGGIITESDAPIKPTTCTNSTHVIKREIILNTEIYSLNKTVFMELWLNVNQIGTGLSESDNFMFALTTGSSSCTDGQISSGNFKGSGANQKLKILDSISFTGTSSKRLFLWIWLDEAETSSATMNQSFSLSLGGECFEGVKTKSAGLYNSDSGDFIPFQTLVQNGDITVTDSVLSKVSTSLEGEIVIPQGITQIKASAFRNCNGVTDIELPDTVSLIGNYAFDGCSSLTSIVIPNSVTSISSLTFRNCTSLTSVVLPEQITEIGQSTFYNCTSLTDIDIPDTVTTIGQNAFYGCSSLQSINLPNGVTEIGDYAFFQCTSLREVSLPAGLTNVSNSLFRMCSSLESVRIPTGITSVGEYAFSGCNKLSDVYYGGTSSAWNSISINVSGNTTLTSATIHYES